VPVDQFEIIMYYITTNIKQSELIGNEA